MSTKSLASDTMALDSMYPLQGGCDCGYIKYRMDAKPLFVHCCHCRWCQRETGSSFALNAIVESDQVTHLGGNPELILTPSHSGIGQTIARCPKCHVAIWSNYPGGGPFLRFIRVGTLDQPDLFPPDIHIYTASKQPWVILSPSVPMVDEFYELEKYWPSQSFERWKVIAPKVHAYNASQPSVST
ncbi:glutathione-dependent formaldehyde-activating GFA [Rhexocercosporidium sp. MPI-PUGE-AT-0058]|nr:glutathione-dependent formaldehyde-activating GFA [Rhexocercosporidium sp. MPI-PUGE-AT-0058]